MSREDWKFLMLTIVAVTCAVLLLGIIHAAGFYGGWQAAEKRCPVRPEDFRER